MKSALRQALDKLATKDAITKDSLGEKQMLVTKIFFLLL
jgi:hypothetical protein